MKIKDSWKEKSRDPTRKFRLKKGALHCSSGWSRGGLKASIGALNLPGLRKKAESPAMIR